MVATLGTMIDRIADEIQDSAITAQIQTAIASAIQHYEDERFWFNESRSVTFNTVANQEFYGVADAPQIPDVIKIDDVTITISGNRFTLHPRDYNYIENIAMTTTSVGQPQDYCYYAQQIRLYPIPSSVWSIRLSGVFKLSTTLSATTDTNAWMVEGEQLIRAKAKWIIATDVTHEDAEAMKAAAQEQIALANLRGKTTIHLSSGRTRPTYF